MTIAISAKAGIRTDNRPNEIPHKPVHYTAQPHAHTIFFLCRCTTTSLLVAQLLFSGPPQSLTRTSVGRRTLEHKEIQEEVVEAVPSVKKASSEVSPWTLREVDRLNENPKNASGQCRQ